MYLLKADERSMEPRIHLVVDLVIVPSYEIMFIKSLVSVLHLFFMYF
jgi:hypothetical protein